MDFIEDKNIKELSTWLTTPNSVDITYNSGDEETDKKVQSVVNGWLETWLESREDLVSRIEEVKREGALKTIIDLTCRAIEGEEVPNVAWLNTPVFIFHQKCQYPILLAMPEYRLMCGKCEHYDVERAECMASSLYESRIFE